VSSSISLPLLAIPLANAIGDHHAVSGINKSCRPDLGE
jgi:hypothetical protein